MKKLIIFILLLLVIPICFVGCVKTNENINYVAKYERR